MDVLVKKVDEMDDLWKITDRNAVNLIKALKKGPLSLSEARNLVPNSDLYIKELERLGIISIVNNQVILQKKGITIAFGEDQNASRASFIYSLFKEFLDGDRFKGLICLGYYEPHGDFNAVAKDIHFASYLTYTIGKYFELERFPIVFDNDVINKNLFKYPLILIGGPVTNLVTKEVNNFLPIRFVRGKEGWYLARKDEVFSRPEHGMVVKMPNPFNKNTSIMVLAGVRYIGTLAAILAVTKRAELLAGSNTFAHVVRGLDLNNDGLPEDAEVIK